MGTEYNYDEQVISPRPAAKQDTDSFAGPVFSLLYSYHLRPRCPPLDLFTPKTKQRLVNRAVRLEFLLTYNQNSKLQLLESSQISNPEMRI